MNTTTTKIAGEAMTDRLKPGHCHKCGLPLSDNPHPEAGKPPQYLQVGCPKECIPCLTLSRHQWAARAMKAENEVKDLLASKPAVAVGLPDEVIAWRDAYQGYVDATAEYNTHLKYVREHCPFGTSVDAQYQAMNDAQRKAFSLLKPMHDALAASPTAPAQSCGDAEQADEAVTLPQAVLDALRFYANGHHYNIDEDHQQFDTVSGEPQNWLFSERDDDCTMIEDGRIAKAVLQGIATAFEEPSPPIEGEVFAARAKDSK